MKKIQYDKKYVSLRKNQTSQKYHSKLATIQQIFIFTSYDDGRFLPLKRIHCAHYDKLRL